MAPTTTALASPRRMASIPSFSATPKVEQAATGAKASPVILPSIEICAAGVLWMFHTTSAETSHGASGAPHCCCSLPRAASRARMTCILPLSTLPVMPVFSISASAARYCASSGESVGPVAMPGVDGGLAILGLGVQGSCGGRRRRDALKSGAAVLLEMGAQGAVPGRLRPEAIPPTLRLVQVDAGVVELADVAEAGADVDVRLLAQFREASPRAPGSAAAPG